MVGEGVKQMFEQKQSKRRRQAEWDRQHVITVSTHLNEMENAFFRLACAWTAPRGTPSCRNWSGTG